MTLILPRHLLSATSGRVNNHCDGNYRQSNKNAFKKLLWPNEWGQDLWRFVTRNRLTFKLCKKKPGILIPGAPYWDMTEECTAQVIKSLHVLSGPIKRQHLWKTWFLSAGDTTSPQHSACSLFRTYFILPYIISDSVNSVPLYSGRVLKLLLCAGFLPRAGDRHV